MTGRWVDRNLLIMDAYGVVAPLGQRSIMCDVNNRLLSLALQALQCMHDAVLARLVDVRRNLVENPYGLIMQNTTNECDAQSLTGRKAARIRV